MIDFESLLKKIEDSYALNLPFVAYREPIERIVKLLIQSDDDLHLTNEFSKSGFIFAPFNNQEKSVLIPLDDSTYVEADFENIDFPSDELSAEIVNEVERQKHIDLISEGIRFIKSNDVEKVVLSRKEDVSDPNLSPGITFRNLLNAYQKAMVYIWYHPKKGLWFGASPEKLIALRDNQFHTVSLAGTQPYRATDFVKWEEKEIEEQQIVTDYITSNLESIADTVVVSKVKTVKAGNLLHLSTEISGNLKKGKGLYSIVNRLHPTPAVCGMPKDAAKTFIIENEGYNREFYTGFLGEVHMNNSSNLFVNLRCMKANNSKMTLFLGGGITIGSIPEKEWEETVEKSKVMKKVLRN